MRNTPIVVALATVLLHCASLAPITPDTCGNGVIDRATEDCDTLGAHCAKAGDPNQCRFTCNTNAECNVGWGCGVDKICRQETGDLAVATAPVSADVFTLLAGDFDGDGHTDIVGSPTFGSAGASRVHYFDGNAALGTTRVIDLPIPIGIVRDFDGDGRSDLGFASRGLDNGGFAALAGQSDRTFATIVFPSLSLVGPAAFTVVTASTNVHLPDGIGSCAVGIESDGNFHSLCGTSVAGNEFNVPSSIHPADLYGRPRVGVIHSSDKDAGRICGEVVFATNTDKPRVIVASPCTLTVDGKGSFAVEWTPPSSPLAKAIELVTPDGSMIDQQVFVGPIAGDGRDSIVIHTAANHYYSYNGTAGAFEELTGPLHMAVQSTQSPQPGQPPPALLASGDLDGDGSVDFVFSSGIAFVTASPIGDAGAPTVRLMAPRDRLRWSQAMIGRLNGDDLPDVVVAFPDSFDVDVLGNGGGGRFSSFTVRSEKVVREVTIGDFDGDRVQDVAFLEADAPLENGGSSDLVLAFGSATGAPEAPSIVGHFKDARGFGPLRDAVNAADDLAVVSGKGTGDTSVSVLSGSGARRQIAPLFISDTNATVPYEPQGGAGGGKKPPGLEIGVGNKPRPGATLRLWQPVSFNVGAFQHASTQEILSIATGFVFDLKVGAATSDPFVTGAWIASSNAATVGGLNPFKEVKDLAGLVGLDEAQLRKGMIAVGSVTANADLDGDGLDEVVSLSSAPNGAEIVVVKIIGESAVATPTANLPGASVHGNDPIDLVDLDGDGILDVVFITTVAGKRSLFVLRGMGHGAFSPTFVKLEAATEMVGFARLETGTRQNGAVRRELAVVSSTTLVLARLKQDGSGFDVTDWTKALGTTSPAISAIVSGDVDGDGVPDLAIADGGAIRIVVQKPRLK